MTSTWRSKVAAILCAFLPGEQYGNAITDLIMGDVVPQARLPVTMPQTENGQGLSKHQWPGIPSKDFPGHLEVSYSEKLLSGYRWYDKHGVTPAYPFGFGLTYGSFSYADLHVSGRTVTFTVSRDTERGCDTPQVYLSYPGAANDPEAPSKVLRYFQKVCNAGQTVVNYTFTERDLSQWDVAQKAWVLACGTFGVHVAPASQGGSALHSTLDVAC